MWQFGLIEVTECDSTDRLRWALSDATVTLRLVLPTTRAADTSVEAYEELTRIWRSRTNQERWALLAALDADVEGLARSGILWAHPDFTEAQVDRELFRRRYGDQLTMEAWSEPLP